jgi:dienelactone hydrolase
VTPAGPRDLLGPTRSLAGPDRLTRPPLLHRGVLHRVSGASQRYVFVFDAFAPRSLAVAEPRRHHGAVKRWWGLLLVLVLLATACSSGRSDTPAKSSDPGSAPSTTASRSFPVARTELQLSKVGFRGQMFSPRVPNSRTAVLVISGSNGGLGTAASVAADLAQAGFPALAIAYFKEPGLPDQLEAIPLEYFATALKWLARQRGVDRDAVVTWGVSRGSEAALLLGVNYPKLVHGVAALVPSNVTLCAYPSCPKPAWTLHGTAIPFQTFFGPTAASPDTAIPVEKITGPVLLVCGQDDQVWPSCPMAEAIVTRLDQRPTGPPPVLLEYPGVGHAIAFLRPASITGSTGPFSPDPASPAAALETARQMAWPRALEFLAAVANS